MNRWSTRTSSPYLRLFKVNSDQSHSKPRSAWLVGEGIMLLPTLVLFSLLAREGVSQEQYEANMQPPAQTPHFASRSLFTACGLDCGRLCPQRQYDIPSLIAWSSYSSLYFYPVLHIDLPRETLSGHFAGAAVILFCILQQTTNRADRGNG